jgi:hypothetical protein
VKTIRALTLSLLLCSSLLTARVVLASPTTPPQCPAGQVPTWDNSGCMQTQQQYSLGSYGPPTAQKAVPQGGLNGAPAMHDCNGIPAPLSVSCSAASPSFATQSITSIVANANAAAANSASSSSTTATPSQPAITIVGTGQPGSSTYTPTVSTGTDSTAALTSLLGDWYTGWMQYVAAAFNFDIGNLQAISSNFQRIPSCFEGQASTCQTAIWQQISQWVPYAPGASGTAGQSS